MRETLEIRFFASIRERLQMDRLTYAPARSVNELLETLSDEFGSAWVDVLREANVIVAVNHAVVTLDHALHAGDEVAFFPPVTGG